MEPERKAPHIAHGGSNGVGAGVGIAESADDEAESEADELKERSVRSIHILSELDHVHAWSAWHAGFARPYLAHTDWLADWFADWLTVETQRFLETDHVHAWSASHAGRFLECFAHEVHKQTDLLVSHVHRPLAVHAGSSMICSHGRKRQVFSSFASMHR